MLTIILRFFLVNQLPNKCQHKLIANHNLLIAMLKQTKKKMKKRLNEILKVCIRVPNNVIDLSN